MSVQSVRLRRLRLRDFRTATCGFADDIPDATSAHFHASRRFRYTLLSPPHFAGAGAFFARTVGANSPLQHHHPAPVNTGAPAPPHAAVASGAPAACTLVAMFAEAA